MQQTKELTGIAALQEMVRASSLHQLRQQAKDESLGLVHETRTDGPVHGHWMSLILMAGQPFRLTYKVFYSSPLSRALPARRLESRPDDISDSIMADFMREFCNLMAGGVKRTLAQMQIPVGLSLPLVTRGFDEVFLPVLPQGTRSRTSGPSKVRRRV